MGNSLLKEMCGETSLNGPTRRQVLVKSTVSHGPVSQIIIFRYSGNKIG